MRTAPSTAATPRRGISPGRAVLVTLFAIVSLLVAVVITTVGEILGRGLAAAVRVVVGVFALEAMIALLDLFLTHT